MGGVIPLRPMKPRLLAERHCRQQLTAMTLLLAEERDARMADGRINLAWLREFRADPFIASLGWGRRIEESF